MTTNEKQGIYSRWTPEQPLAPNPYIEEARQWNEKQQEEDRRGIIVLEPQIALNEAIIGFNDTEHVLVYSVKKLIQCYQSTTDPNLSEEEAWNWFMFANYTVKYPNYPIFQDYPANSDGYMKTYFQKLQEQEKS